MPQHKNIDTSIADKIIRGRVEPHIYAFNTGTVPNYLKVGDTQRPVEQRLAEWKEKFKDLKEKFSSKALVDDKTYFRDFEVHKYLIRERERERLQPGKFSDIYYSKEFFKDATTNDVKDAIENIIDSHTKNESTYQFYNLENLILDNFIYVREKEEKFTPRPNQEQTINNFERAWKNGSKSLLMYAVMRFGKSYTAMCCAKVMKAKVIVIVSAKADVMGEWKRTVETLKRFEGYEFLDRKVLWDKKAISKKLKANKKVVIFLTLQDLQGNNRLQGNGLKEQHKEIFGKDIDLLIIDETHFGARASEYGKVLDEKKLTQEEKLIRKEQQQQNKLKERDFTLDELESSTKVLKTKLRLHLSGTPYRILMGGEFSKDDIIAFYQFSDIAKDQDEWNKKHLNEEGVNEWDNPYFGFPQMVRFAFNPNESSRKKMDELKQNGFNYAFSALFIPKSITKDNVNQNHKKFEHEKEVLDLLQVIDGSKSDKNILGFLNYNKIKEGNMCRHIVCVLPFRASCDAFEDLIQRNQKKFVNLNTYEIINIAGVDKEEQYKDTENIKIKIKKCENEENKKTITLTVNRMLTGSTVEEWDTMLYFKDTSSPQEYDQAIFRLQNPYIKNGIDKKSSSVFKYNKKPQTLLVDFNPNRMFLLQEEKSQIYNANTDANGNSKLEERIKRELEISPIVVMNNNKMEQVVPANILDAVRKYSSDKSVLDEATIIPVDFSLLKNDQIRTEIEKQAKIQSKQGLEIKANEGEGEDIDVPTYDTEGSEIVTGKTKPMLPKYSADESEKSDFKSKFAMYYSKILFFAFLTDSKVKSLEEIIKQIGANKNNERIAISLDLNKLILTLLQTKINRNILSRLDYKIQNINSLANDITIAPIKRASNAFKKFGRLSVSEVVTPEFVTDKMINSLPVNAINKSTMLLDIASKQGEFVYAVYKMFGKEVANNFYSIPTSKIAYEFTRKVYTLLELDINFIEKSYTSYELIKENKLIQDDTIKINKRKMKFNVIVGNPPYQQSDGGHGRSAGPIYQKFVELTKKLNPTLLSIIIPARWFAGGKGLDDFRKEMLNDKHISKLVDFENANDIFPGVDIAGGICFFLRDKNNTGLCEITNYVNGQENKSKRPLNEFSTFIRHSQAIPIIGKVLAKKDNSGKNLSKVVSSRKPFGLPTNYNPKNSGIPCWFTQRIGLKYASKTDITNDAMLLDKWKLLIPPAPIAGQTDFSKPVGFYYDGNVRIAKPGECCTESFIVAGAFSTKKETESFKSYLFTKIVRFLLLQTVVSQHVTKDKFIFIPDLGKYEGVYTDEFLCKRWGITKEEWAFIDSKIKSIDK